MGGMPGMGGMRGMLPLLLAKLFGSGAGGMPQLPGGLQPQHLLIGAGLLFFVLPRVLGVGMLPMMCLGGAAAFVMRGVAGGKGFNGVLEQGRDVLDRVGQAVKRATGKDMSAAQAALFIAAVVYLIYRYGPFGGDGSAAGDDGGSGGYAAYSKGFDDGMKGRKFDPISDAPSSSGSSSSSSSSGFGIGKLFSLAMAGSMIYQMGGQPWSLEALVANLRHMQPMQMVMLFSVVSGLFS